MRKDRNLIVTLKLEQPRFRHLLPHLSCYTIRAVMEVEEATKVKLARQ